MALAENRSNEAIGLYKRLISSSQTDQVTVSDVINLGALLRSSGNLEEAAQHYHHWIKAFPPQPQLSINAANCFRQLGRAEEGARFIERALVEESENLDLLVSQAECWLDLGLIKQCQEQLQKVLQIDPSKRLAWISLGVALARIQRLNEALFAFTKAHELNKSDFRMAANRISLLKDLGKLDEAEEVWREISPEQKSVKEIRGALAGLKLAQNKPEEATLLLSNLCQEEPEQEAHWLNWAAALRSLKYTVAPRRVLQMALQYHPQDWSLQEAYGQILAEMGLIEEAKRLAKRQSINHEPAKDIHIFNRQFLGASYKLIDSNLMRLEAQSWEQMKRAEGVGALWPDTIRSSHKNRVLRIGYISSDYCNHPVARFLLPILQNHDHLKIETWAISCGSHDDWITDLIKNAADNWLDLRYTSDLQAARVLSDLQLDVLVELGGFTGGSRVGVLTHKPAPIQLSYLGYPSPTYLKCVDGWIGDNEIFDGLNSLEKKAHPLININNGYMAFDPGGEIEIASRTNKESFRYGCFNHARKLTAESIQLFCNVMKENEDAELVLKSISFHEAAERERIKARFAKAGLNTKRLILLEWVEGGINHLHKYHEIDVALDPTPYGGATTTCEALWMGVPVVTLRGAGMAGRLASTLLLNAGFPEWIANSKEEFVEICSRMKLLGKRDEIERKSLREKISNSPIADPKRLASSLEENYLRLISRTPET